MARLKLKQAVDEYIEFRRAAGSPAISNAATLKAFCRSCGDIALVDVSPDMVDAYVSGPNRAASTRASVFSGLKCFLVFQGALGRIQPFPMKAPPKVRDRRPPRIYTKDEVRRLLDGTTACQSNAPDCDGNTLRLGLLLLYATGATVSEILSLRCVEVRADCRSIRFGRGDTERSLPISALLAAKLRKAIFNKRPDDFIVCNRHGSPLSGAYLAFRFRRLTRQIGTADSLDGHPPRLQDFRYTFAVHRIESWIQQKADLNVLLPALSTYMGYADLLKAEEFLSMTPEHFRGDLAKLSSSQSSSVWRDDPHLLGMLSRL